MIAIQGRHTNNDNNTNKKGQGMKKVYIPGGIPLPAAVIVTAAIVHVSPDAGMRARYR